MAGFRLAHVERFKDRLGKTRYYYRKGKGKRIALVGTPGSAEFGESYQRASNTYAVVARSEEGTFNALARLYFASSKFVQKKKNTQKQARYRIEKFLVDHGHRQVSEMQTQDVEKLFASKSATPAEANTILKYLRQLIALALRMKWIKEDPTQGIDWFKTGEWHTWNEAEIAQFESYWPVGKRQRLAFDLFLYTGQRLSDVSKMQRAHIVGSLISVAQEKADDELNDRFLRIPMHSNLQKSLALWPVNGPMLIYYSAAGRAYTSESLGHFLARAITKAALPDRCVVHGLRKAAARRLAEAGCSVHEIASITGHKTLAMVQKYTLAVEQARLARSAMDSLGK